MPASSAGILMYRRTSKTTEVLLVHPGGPFWRDKDRGAWSIPKGEIEPGEGPADVAEREFLEELGSAAGQPLRALGEIRQRGGKRVIAFGRRKAGGDRAFRRSIVRNGLIWRAREREDLPASNRFSTGSMEAPGRQLI